jgi:phosphoribosylformylglycinamidine cyclo-ligase
MPDYKSSGVDYDMLDKFKREAQQAAQRTANNVQRLGLATVENIRGRSAFVLKNSSTFPIPFIGHVEEGLGTKNLVADRMSQLTKKSYYYQIGQDTVAMIVNDMISAGILPISVAMHLAVGNSNWFSKNQDNAESLISGWEHACNLSRCVWGPGETATLRDIIYPDAIELSGSAIGINEPNGALILEENIREGDMIVFLESSGIHANGLTLVRDIVKKLSNGYLTKLPNGKTFGEEILTPTPIYVGVVEDCFNSGIKIHYAENITGHGWRKLMRPLAPFNYIIEHLPSPHIIFDFLQEHGQINDLEAYGTFNMGAGFALYVQSDDVTKVISNAKENSIEAYRAGYVAKSRNAEKKVIICPKDLEYTQDTLKVR